MTEKKTAAIEPPVLKGEGARLDPKPEDVFDLANCDDIGAVHDLMNQEETRKELGISTNTLKGWVRKEGFPAPTKVGAFQFYSRRRIQLFMLARMAEQG